MRVFVTGADGFIGRHTAEALRAAGHSVVGLVRKPQKDTDGVTYVTGSITDTSVKQLAERMADCEAIIHLVGIITEVRSEGQTFERVHVQGTKNLLAAARQANIPLKRFVYISAIGASEEAQSEYSRTKAQAEAAVISSGFPYTIFRPSIVFGREAAFLKQIESLIEKPPLSPFPLPFVPVPGDGQTRFQPLYISDLTYCLTACLTDHQTAGTSYEVGTLYEIGGSDEVTFDEMVAMVEEHLGKKKSILHAPLPVMFAAASILESVLPHPPVTTDQLLMLSVDNVCDNTSVREAFGFVPLPFAETLTRSYRAD